MGSLAEELHPDGRFHGGMPRHPRGNRKRRPGSKESLLRTPGKRTRISHPFTENVCKQPN